MIRTETFLENRLRLVRVWLKLAAAFVMALMLLPFGVAASHAETRTLKLFYVHTGERAEITFKRNGRYDPAGLAQANRLLRDWRHNEPTKMNPRLLDLIWTAYQQTGSNAYITVVCGYRSPATNSMLRSRSKGVAKKSQHMLGNAMDFFIPGVPLKKLREIGLKMQGGGVGYYPTSGSPFVHFDVGNVRHWPKMSRSELVALFPNGRTLHVPSDGRPLPGFDQALADYQARKAAGSTALALADTGAKKPGKGLLAMLFGRGGGADEEEDNNSTADAEEAPAPRATRTQPVQVVTAAPAASDDSDFAAVAADGKRQMIVAALPDRSALLPETAPRPKTAVGENVTAAELPIAMDDPATADPAQPVAEPPATIADIMKAPLPSWRPDNAPAGDDAGLLALADMKAPLPTQRPELDKLLASADPGVDQTTRTMAVRNTTANDRDLIRADSEAIASLINASAPSDLAAERAIAKEPLHIVKETAKSTQKSARASRKDVKPPTASIVLPAQPADARWAFDDDYVMKGKPGATAPSYAYHIVRTAPREVYANGFQPGGKALPTRKFTGTAVAFMPVARFETN